MGLLRFIRVNYKPLKACLLIFQNPVFIRSPHDVFNTVMETQKTRHKRRVFITF